MDKALQTMINNMPEKTGKSLEEWKVLLAEKAFQKHMEAVKFLKSEHGVSHGFANTIVSLSKNAPMQDDDLLKQQYQGKEQLFPIYEELLKRIKEFGRDIQVSPKKTSVSLIRKKQFALIKPATKTRIDLGLKIVDKPVGGRLENSGPFGTMCTHRVRLESLENIDEEVLGWLREAYDASK
jgi:predicted transport protein